MTRLLFQYACLLLVILHTSAPLRAQYHDTIPKFFSDKSNTAYFDVKAHTFFHNEEFLNQSQGATWIGYLLQPKFRYHLSKKTVATAGVHLQQFSGNNTKLKAYPLFSIEHTFSNQLKLIMGHIYGNSHYGLDEQLYHFRHYYLDPVQYGIQFIADGKVFKSQLWLQWRQFIQYDDAFQESLIVGNSSEVKLWSDDKYSISIPFSGTIVHRGGEIDSSPQPVTTVLNVSMGLRGIKKFNMNKSIELYTKYYIFSAIDNPIGAAHYLPIDNGNGIKIGGKMLWNRWSMQLDYWDANNYVAPLGEELLTTSFQDGVDPKTKHRYLMPKLFYEKQLSNRTSFTGYAGVYAELLDHTIDYAYGIHLKIHLQRKLKL